MLRCAGQAWLGIRLLCFLPANAVFVDALRVVFYTEATRGSVIIALGFLCAAATACRLRTFEPSVAPRPPEPITTRIHIHG
jgi:hypothetical protein